MSRFLRTILKSKHIYILALALLLLAVSGLKTEWVAAVPESWMLLAWLVLLLAVFPLPFALPALGAVLALSLGLAEVNRAKLALMGFPLTYMDLRIFARNPQGLFDALGWPWWSTVLFFAVVGFVLAFLIFVLLRSALSLRTAWPTVVSGSVILPAAALFAVLGAIPVYLVHFMHSTHDRFLEKHPFWRVQGVIELSEELGTVPFLVYSYHVERLQTGDYFNRRLGTVPPSDEQIREAVLKHVNFGTGREQPRPNIMLIFAESTFDPSDVFHLENPLPDNPLFVETEYTQALGPLYVNPVGGGSWISEFESLTGVDSRLFGFWGYYTHASLSPLIKKSLVTHLIDRGYRTATYYSADGSFYNARNAFRNYGFELFFDSNDLELSERWGTRDDQMANAVIENALPEDSGPFFKFVSLSGNHAPHRCRNFSDPNEFVTRFAKTDDFDYNCVLNEFIRDTQFTAKAIERLIAYLEEVEARTGRPFVALVYGDHQPHTFTGTGGERWHWGEIRDYRPLRRLNERHTFFHLVSSVRDVITCCGDAVPHLTLVPSILSAYVASEPADIYLGINFFKFANCGPDLMAASREGNEFGVDELQTPAQGMAATYLVGGESSDSARKCWVYDQILAAKRKSGVL